MDDDEFVPESKSARKRQMHALQVLGEQLVSLSFYFQFYKEGVIDIPSNHSQNLNHAVLLVGVDSDENGLHWIIQNSWGSKWGDNGFARIRAIDGDGVLLSNLYGVYPTKI